MWTRVAVRQKHGSVEYASSSGGKCIYFALKDENLFQNLFGEYFYSFTAVTVVKMQRETC